MFPNPAETIQCEQVMFGTSAGRDDALFGGWHHALYVCEPIRGGDRSHLCAQLSNECQRCLERLLDDYFDPNSSIVISGLTKPHGFFVAL